MYKKTDENLLEKNLTKIATKIIDRKILHNIIYKDLVKFTPTLNKHLPLYVTDKKVETKEKNKEEKVNAQEKNTELKLKIETPKQNKTEKNISKDAKTDETKKSIFQENKIKEKNLELKKEIVEDEILKQEQKNTEAPLKQKRNTAFQQLSDDLFKEKLNSSKDKTEKEKRRIEAMKKLQEELFTNKRDKEQSSSTKKTITKKDTLEKKESESIKETILQKETIIVKKEHNKEPTEEEKKELLQAERKAKALILKIKAQQEELVETEKSLHAKKIESLKDKLKYPKGNNTVYKKQEEVKEVKEDAFSLERKQRKEALSIKIKALKEKLAKEKELELKNKQTEDKEAETKLNIVSKDNIKKDILKKEEKEIEVSEKNIDNKKAQKTEAIKQSTNFLDWLKNKNQTTKIEEKTIVAEQKEKKDLIPFERTSNIEVEMHKEIKQSTDPLDTFISKQIARKKIVKQKETRKKVNKTAFATETLAEIYMTQQKYNEAIEVYATLSLKYPQKSIYFADQIEKIKTYL